MKYDIVIGGVGGQGILSIAAIIDNTAMRQGLHFKQSEVHGMAQRGGAVSSHLRVSDAEIFSDLVALRSADLLLSVEPMEALRYRQYLSARGVIVTSSQAMVNIPVYPDLGELHDEITAQGRSVLINADKIAREAGSPRAQNMVVLGAASPFIPLDASIMQDLISELFAKKGERVLQANLNAFRFGLASGQFYTAAIELGCAPRRILALMDHLDSAGLNPELALSWCRVLGSPVYDELARFWDEQPERILAAGDAIPDRVLSTGVGFLREA